MRHSTRREPRSPAERRHVEETVAAIRLRTRHHDPYEEWEKQTRKDALVRVSR
jgi:nucleoporin GLE1